VRFGIGLVVYLFKNQLPAGVWSSQIDTQVGGRLSGGPLSMR